MLHKEVIFLGFCHHADKQLKITRFIPEEETSMEVIKMQKELTFRYAERKDTGLILQFIKDLAAYEKMANEVIAEHPIRN